MFSLDNEFYTSEFAKQNMMGPNALRIVEELMEGERVEKGARILDLGCGTGLTSMFLAKKYDATVFAVDLWIGATENYERFRAFALDDRIIPLHAEAHELPFANEYFDIAVSVDSYHYFGCDEEYLPKYLDPLLKKSGKLIVGVPGLKKEFTTGVPPELVPYWQEDMNSFHSCVWWKDLWSRDEAVTVDECTELRCTREAWADWLASGNPYAIDDIDMMAAEGGKYFSLVGIKATRK